MNRRLLRRYVRAATVLTGFAIGCAMLGRPVLAIAAAALAAAAALYVLTHLVRMGDR